MKKRSLFLLTGAAATAAYVGLVRPWMLRWGATPGEARRPLPGDALVPTPRLAFTRAITIEAPAAQVWPWLVQLGSHRAGWYSYDWVDNTGHPSADRVLPELQDLRVGDQVWAVPDGTFVFPVVALEPNRALVLGGTLDIFTGQPAAGGGADPATTLHVGWAFVLDELTPAELYPALTRLIVRFQADFAPSLLGAVAGAVLEPVSFLMERKMLLGIKARVERQAQAGANGPSDKELS